MNRVTADHPRVPHLVCPSDSALTGSCAHRSHSSEAMLSAAYPVLLPLPRNGTEALLSSGLEVVP
jgi:hypothetical protein